MTLNFKFPEGATPIDDCSGLIPQWVHTLHDLNRVEAENIMNALAKYLRGSINNPTKWFHVTELKTIHKSMLGNVWEWAGTYRKSNTSIGVNPSLIPTQLAELCIDVRSWMEHPVELTFIEMAARIHHRLVFIHPFENGNGRFSRLLSDRFLLACRCPYPIWPSHLNKEGTIRKNYIETLKSADNGDYLPLVEFMKKLGGRDPTICELLQNKFYNPYINGERGALLVRALIRNGNTSNDETLSGHRALQLAVKANLEKIAAVLIETGADIEHKDKSGLTPLQIAITQKNKIITDILVSKGAKQLSPTGLERSKTIEA